MAQVFISCNHRDFALGASLERALVRLGHVMTMPIGSKPAGRWEERLLRALHTADTIVSVLTPAGMGSPWVLAQTGMAISCEYTRNALVLPVCPQGVIPNFVASLHCFFSTGTGPAAVGKLAGDLNDAIVAHRASRPPRIFISHRHKDALVARKLIELLRSAFHVGSHDIRCTSVPGYQLAVGSQSAGSLQADLNGAEIVMGMIGPDTSDSEYVLFELGASWGLGKPTFPLRIRGARYGHVPEVLRERSSLSLEDLTQCLQLVEDVARASSLSRKQRSATGRGAAAIRRLAEQLCRAAKA